MGAFGNVYSLVLQGGDHGSAFGCCAASGVGLGFRV